MNKVGLRKEISEKRRQLSAAYLKKSEKAIAHAVIHLPEFINADTIFCFVSMSEEINTFPILEQILKMGKRLAVPRCSGKGMMDAFAVSGYADLEQGSYGILEPQRDCLLVEPQEIDFAVIPCVSCNVQGGRLGHGGGYYDRYLSGREYRAAVLCREKLLSDKIPHDKWDQTMDLVVTEKRIIRIRV